MNVRSTLLLSTALILPLGFAEAADLPVTKGAPIEYVRVCSAYGAGFFYIPGTETCLRVSGRARYEYQYTETLSRSAGDVSGYRGLARINLDARTQTDYGTLRAFVRLEAASRSGAYIGGNSQARLGNGFRALGIDTFGRVTQYVNTDKAFIQLAGFTAGRASSFYDFYAHDYEMIGYTGGSDMASTNLLAYTATLGNGFSTTLSMEDPSFRWQPVFTNGSTALGLSPFNAFNGPTSAFSPVFLSYNAAGIPTSVTFADTRQRNRTPDAVAVLRYDGPWGAAQLSAAMHEVNVGNYSQLLGVNGGATPASAAVGRVPSEYGWAVQAGVKLNAAAIAPGDGFYLQGSYGVGAMSYTGFIQPVDYQTTNAQIFNGAPLTNYISDGVINPFTRRLELSESWTIVGSYLHYWNPEWRSAVFASYGEAYFSKTARYGLGLVGFDLPNPTTVAGANAFRYSNVLRDNSVLYTGMNLIWSPVKNLDIGVEGVYQRSGIVGGQVADANRALGAVNGVPLRAVSSADNGMVRFRVQRDF